MNINKGDILAKGEVPGLVGRTGYAMGYHLHLSVYVKEKSVDPESFIDILSVSFAKRQRTPNVNYKLLI